MSLANLKTKITSAFATLGYSYGEVPDESQLEELHNVVAPYFGIHIQESRHESPHKRKLLRHTIVIFIVDTFFESEKTQSGDYRYDYWWSKYDDLVSKFYEVIESIYDEDSPIIESVGDIKFNYVPYSTSNNFVGVFVTFDLHVETNYCIYPT